MLLCDHRGGARWCNPASTPSLLSARAGSATGGEAAGAGGLGLGSWGGRGRLVRGHGRCRGGSRGGGARAIAAVVVVVVCGVCSAALGVSTSVEGRA